MAKGPKQGTKNITNIQQHQTRDLLCSKICWSIFLSFISFSSQTTLWKNNPKFLCFVKMVGWIKNTFQSCISFTLCTVHIKRCFDVSFECNVAEDIMLRCLLRFECQLPHPILFTTLAIDEKWPSSNFHIFYQNSDISPQKIWKSEIGTFGQLICEFW